MIFNLLLLFSLICNCYGNDENKLRKTLFNDYNKDIRPTRQFNESLDVRIGIAVQNIEAFDQIKEKIELNIWVRKYWKNHFISWNPLESNISQLTLSKNEIWTPDIELINAASTPEIYTLKGGMYLYPNGEMLWSMPAVYTISCPLHLKYFPFDSQTCSIRFSSWSYDNSLLNLAPYGEYITQLDVMESFSHSEWELDSYSIETYNETRKCCPNKQFSVNQYNFKLKRYTHYYTLNMGMTISLVIVSFIIMMVKPDNLSRTGTAVFIPLTILALQLTIAGKIPVVGYYTLMDIFFLTCFITSMMVSIESGIIYTMITSKSHFMYRCFETILDFENLLKKYKQKMEQNIDLRKKHDDEIDLYIDNDSVAGSDSTTESMAEFRIVEDQVRESALTDSIHDRNERNIPNKEGCRQLFNREDRKYFDNTLSRDIVRTINHDNIDLSMTFKEYLIFSEISRIAVYIDNCCLVLLPTVFFVIIIIIFSYN
jgi:nicotinic acetylcholine receptor, invertebrate